MPTSSSKLVDRRHPMWLRNELRWRWLGDSLEGGHQYRHAVYGSDVNGYPLRNLVRYKSEVPESGVLVSTASPMLGDHPDYAMRWERTPVPSFVAEAIETHLSKLNSREVIREHPDDRLSAWWEDVDGANTSMDEWLADTVAPLLLILGQVDLYFDRPRAPEGFRGLTEADVIGAGLGRCVAKVVLPENVVWWRLDETRPGRYAEVLVREPGTDEEDRPIVRYRHWTSESWELLDEQGERVDGDSHPFGRVPIVRVFDRLNPRREHVGLSRYEVIAELQKAAYNLESDLILAGVKSNSSPLQAPEEYIQADSGIPIGPGRVLPKKRVTSGSTVHYEGWEFVVPPQGPLESLREDLQRIRDQVDRAAKLTKPAGARGTTGGTVAQSGTSKALDQDLGNALLGQLARTLQKAEWEAAEFALCVIGGRDTTPEQREGLRVVYPTSFSMLSAEETAALVVEFQGIASASGDVPSVEAKQLKALNRLILPGQDDRGFEEDDDAIDAFMETQARRSEELAEGRLVVPPAPPQQQPPAPTPAGDDEEPEDQT